MFQDDEELQKRRVATSFLGMKITSVEKADSKREPTALSKYPAPAFLESKITRTVLNEKRHACPIMGVINKSGATSIVVGERDKLVDTSRTVIDAVRAGELDAAIEAAAKS